MPLQVPVLRQVANHSSLFGKRPEQSEVSGNQAIIGAAENEVQKIVDYFQSWLPHVNRVYEQRICQGKLRGEEKQRQELQRLIEEQERRQRPLKNAKL